MKDCGEESQSSVIIGSISCISHREHSISNILGRQQEQQEENRDENIQTEGSNFKKSHESSEHSLSLLYPFVDESKYPLPKCWNTKEKEKSLALTHNNLRVHYKGQGKSHKDAAAIRIINKGRDGLFGIGLSQAGVSLNRLPGWDKFSYGYHGDDGHSFSFSGSGVPYGPTFSTGDVIGCGLNLIENYCFYTKNGYNIGVAFTDLPPDLYPTVGLQTPGEIIEANFGQFPFVFDIYEEIKQSTRYSDETTCEKMNLMSAKTVAKSETLFS
uniref:B30.2/SPRY domain-containing protein n=1 Tax=Romanomermis culicivorax TaxID=13658 RepID=A0A915KNU5_ROMCU